MNSTFPIAGSLQKIDDFERYRTFWSRFWAGLIDGLVFLPLGILNVYLSRPGRSPLVLVSWAIFFNSTVWAYSIIMHARFGQTVGKMVMHVKVWDVSESRLPSLKQAFLRDIGTVLINVAFVIYFVYLVLSHRYVNGAELNSDLPASIISWADSGWFWLEVITMLTNRKRRALHDLIAGTVVCVD
jgi:uncharacterized RDD family membrane protein YckC